MSKHIICSPEYYDLVVETLQAEAPGEGRETFLRNRAGRVKDKSCIVLQDYLVLGNEVLSLPGVPNEI